MTVIVVLSSIISCCAFAEVQVVDYSIGAKVAAVKEPEPVFVPAPAAASSTKGLGMEQRLGKLENQVTNINEQNFISKIDELQTRVQKLTGQLEDQTHQIEQLNAQVRNFYQDLNQRLEKTNLEKPETEKVKAEKPTTGTAKAINEPVIGEVVEAMPTATTVLATGNKSKATQIQAVPDKARTDKEFLKEQQMYQSALDLLPGKNYETSSKKLRDYIKIYPKGTYVANAHYWLGEINFLKKNYDAAEEEFKIVVDKHAKSKRVADAMFKLALVHQYQGREAQAKQELKKVMQRYPSTSAASLAKTQLEGN
jgi:tol-pal system protein YbgF